MKKYEFKTNINCGGCIARVTPFLNGNTGIKEWQVDTMNPNKILTVETDDLNQGDLIAVIEKAGFKAQSIG